MRLGLVLTSALSLAVVSPVTVIAQQCPDGSPPPCGRAAAPARPAANSIAVLPFASRSPDTADVYLAEGMTDEVGNHLTQVGRLQVKARGVVAAAWQRNPDPLGAARALRVAWYLHGYVRHVARQLLVNVELVRPATGEQVWAKRFARPDADMFAVQAEVAESVAVVVGGRLRAGERAVLARRPTRNNEAYQLYLLGNSLLARRTRAEVRRALEKYSEALRLDPRFAAAWGRVAMARCIQTAWSWGEGVPRDSLIATAQVVASRAIALDSLSADGWLASACAAFFANRVWAAREAYERSLTLDSLNPEAWHQYGRLYGGPPWGLTDYTRSVPLLRRALALDPMLRNTWRQLGIAAYSAGRLAEAEAAFDSSLSLGPWAVGYLARSEVRFVRGNGVGALADLAEVERLENIPYGQTRALYTVLLGDSAPARAELARVRAQADGGRPDHARIAVFSMALGAREEALSSLERLRTTPNPREPRCAPATPCSASLQTWQALHDPIFALLRGDPRFERLWEETRPRVPWLEGYH